MRIALTAVLIALIVNAICNAESSCAVTEAPSPVFIPPPPYDASPGVGSFYLGSDDFWTVLPSNGVWETRHDHATYDRSKVVWFSEGYWWLSQRQEDLRVDARKLDGGSESVHVAWVTNGFIPESQTSFMLNDIEFPSTGCWEISASWHAHELKFVVLVTPEITSSSSSSLPLKK